MIPITNHINGRKRMERKLIKKLQPTLNTLWTKKKEGKKRKRPAKKYRKESKTNNNQYLDKHNNKTMLSTPYTIFFIGQSPYADLFDVIKRHYGGNSIEITWKTGEIDASNYVRLRKTYKTLNGMMTIEGMEKQICFQSVNQLKHVIRSNHKGTIRVENIQLNDIITHYTKLALNLRKRNNITNISDDVLWKLFAAKRFIRKKPLRQAIQYQLTRICKEKFGTSIPNKITIRVPYNKVLPLGRIQHMAIDLIKISNLPNVAKELLIHKVRPVYTKQPNIGDIAMNFMNMARSMDINKYGCVCKQKAKTECQNHQINKIIDISDDTLLPLKRHRKMIPFPDDPGTWKKVYMEFNKLKSLLTKMDKNMESINIYEYIRGNMKSSKSITSKRTTLSAYQVRIATRQLKGWLITYADKNPGMLIACCPVWYAQNTWKTFKYGGENDTYILVEKTEEEILRDWRQFHKEHLGKTGSFNRKGKLPYGYILPKFKDLNKTRPIVSYYYHPLRRLLNIFARALTFLLKSCTEVRHLTIWTTDALMQNIKHQTEEWMADNECEYAMVTGDIKNMYTMLPPEEQTKAVEWLIEMMLPTRREKYITIKRRGREGARFGRSYNKTTHLEIKMTQILTMVQFDTSNCFFKIGNTILKQVWGVPMGSPMSPIIAILVCARREHYCIQGLAREKQMIRAFRYVDDMLIMMKYRKGKRHLTEKIITKVMTCYHKSMEMSVERYGTKIEFLEYQISMEKHTIEMGHLCKNEEQLLKTGTLKFKKLPEADSFAPRKQKLGLIIGNFCRIGKHCSNIKTLVLAMEQTCTEMQMCGYGKNLLYEALERMYQKTGSEIWRTMKKLPTFGRVTI